MIVAGETLPRFAELLWWSYRDLMRLDERLHEAQLRRVEGKKKDWAAWEALQTYSMTVLLRAQETIIALLEDEDEWDYETAMLAEIGDE